MRTRIAIVVAGAGCALLSLGVASAAPGISVSPASVSFGSVCVGAPAGERAVTISNPGDQPLEISQIAVTGANPQEFTLKNAQPRTVAAGKTSSFSVGFQPNAVGDRSAIVRIASNAPSSPTEMAVAGRGATRSLEVTPTRLSFGDQRIKSPSDELVLSMASVGSEAVHITKVGSTGANAAEFAVKGPSRTTVEPGSDSITSITFRPAATGRRTAAVSIESDACAGRFSIGVEGVGTAPKLKLSPSVIDFGFSATGVPSASVPVVLANQGRAPLRVTKITMEGDAPGDFRFEALPDTPRVVGPGDELPLAARFVPGADGPRTAVLRIESDDPDAPVLRVPLRGNVGTPSPTPSETQEPAVVEPANTSTPRPAALEGRSGGSSGGAGDWIAVALVFIMAGGTFGGLFAIARRRTAQE